MLTQDRLKTLVLYDKERGTFTWKHTINGTAIEGHIAGFVHKSTGYLCITIDKRTYGAHRLAFLYVEGDYPEYVDHKDRDRTNLKWSNLRRATGSQNRCNSGLMSNNTSGFKGITFYTNSGEGYNAEVKLEGNRITKGFSVKKYKSKAKALEAARAWVTDQRNKIHGEFACHG